MRTIQTTCRWCNSLSIGFVGPPDGAPWIEERTVWLCNRCRNVFLTHLELHAYQALVAASLVLLVGALCLFFGPYGPLRSPSQALTLNTADVSAITTYTGALDTVLAPDTSEERSLWDKQNMCRCGQDHMRNDTGFYRTVDERWAVSVDGRLIWVCPGPQPEAEKEWF